MGISSDGHLNSKDFLALFGKSSTEGNTAARGTMDNDAKLAQLIRGKELDQAGHQARFDNARNEAMKMAGIDPSSPTAQKDLGEWMVSRGAKLGMKEGGLEFGAEPGAYDRSLAREERAQDREERAVERLEKRSSDMSVPATREGLRRAEASIPGITTGQAKFKSAGGLKGLIPGWAVPIAEGLGKLTGGVVGMEPGAAEERAALQDLLNTKIYDSSGKQINKDETVRIKEASGFSGVAPPEIINQFGAQTANTAFQKQKNLTAGARPSAVATFKKGGGLAGAQTLDEYLGPLAAKKPLQAPQAAGALAIETKMGKDGKQYQKNPQSGLWESK